MSIFADNPLPSGQHYFHSFSTGSLFHHLQRSSPKLLSQLLDVTVDVPGSTGFCHFWADGTVHSIYLNLPKKFCTVLVVSVARHIFCPCVSFYTAHCFSSLHECVWTDFSPLCFLHLSLLHVDWESAQCFYVIRLLIPSRQKSSALTLTLTSYHTQLPQFNLLSPVCSFCMKCESPGCHS